MYNIISKFHCHINALEVTKERHMCPPSKAQELKKAKKGLKLHVY